MAGQMVGAAPSSGNDTATAGWVLTEIAGLGGGGGTPRVLSLGSSATPSVNTDNYDLVVISGLATAITSMTTNLTGTFHNGQRLTYRVSDNGTAQTITWGAKFLASGVTALLATTVVSKKHTVVFMYDAGGSVWVCLACDTVGY